MGECTLDGTRLRISAVFLDTVTHAGRVDLSDTRERSEEHLQEQCLKWWNQCAAMHMLTPVIHITGEARNEALMQTLVAGLKYEHEKASYHWAYGSYCGSQRYVHRNNKSLFVSKSTLSVKNEMCSWAVVSAILGRVFFITQRGGMGLAPLCVQPGDEVAIMLGCDIPLMLRRAGHGLDGPEYHLLGECFLHGVMFGEALQGRQLPVTSIVLL